MYTLNTLYILKYTKTSEIGVEHTGTDDTILVMTKFGVDYELGPTKFGLISLAVHQQTYLVLRGIIPVHIMK